MSKSEWLTIKELAEELKVPVATIYAWRLHGAAPRSARFGKHVRFRRVDVDRWTAEQYDGEAA